MSKCRHGGELNCFAVFTQQVSVSLRNRTEGFLVLSTLPTTFFVKKTSVS